MLLLMMLTAHTTFVEQMAVTHAVIHHRQADADDEYRPEEAPEVAGQNTHLIQQQEKSDDGNDHRKDHVCVF